MPRTKRTTMTYSLSTLRSVAPALITLTLSAWLAACGTAPVPQKALGARARPAGYRQAVLGQRAAQLRRRRSESEDQGLVLYRRTSLGDRRSRRRSRSRR